MTALTPDEKIRNIVSQLVLIESGQINAISCPYCQKVTPAGETLCCTTLAVLVRAILDRQEVEAQKELLDRVSENLDKRPHVTVN